MNVTINITVNLGVEHARQLVKLAEHQLVRNGVLRSLARKVRDEALLWAPERAGRLLR